MLLILEMVRMTIERLQKTLLELFWIIYRSSKNSAPATACDTGVDDQCDQSMPGWSIVIHIHPATLSACVLCSCVVCTHVLCLLHLNYCPKHLLFVQTCVGWQQVVWSCLSQVLPEILMSSCSKNLIKISHIIQNNKTNKLLAM